MGGSARDESVPVAVAGSEGKTLVLVWLGSAIGVISSLRGVVVLVSSSGKGLRLSMGE